MNSVPRISAWTYVRGRRALSDALMCLRDAAAVRDPELAFSRLKEGLRLLRAVDSMTGGTEAKCLLIGDPAPGRTNTGEGSSPVVPLQRIAAAEMADTLDRARRRLGARVKAGAPWFVRGWFPLLLAGIVLCGLLFRAATFACAALSEEGLVVTYFQGIGLEKRVCSRTEFVLFKDYGRKRPAWRVRRDGWSARWEGYLVVPVSAEYDFFAQSDDGLRLLLDNEPVIDNWKVQGFVGSGAHGRQWLAAGSHRLKVEHFNEQGNSALRVKWCGGPIPGNTVLSAPYLRKRPEEPVTRRPSIPSP